MRKFQKGVLNRSRQQKDKMPPRVHRAYFPYSTRMSKKPKTRAWSASLRSSPNRQIRSFFRNPCRSKNPGSHLAVTFRGVCARLCSKRSRGRGPHRRPNSPSRALSAAGDRTLTDNTQVSSFIHSPTAMTSSSRSTSPP